MCATTTTAAAFEPIPATAFDMFGIAQKGMRHDNQARNGHKQDGGRQAFPKNHERRQDKERVESLLYRHDRMYGQAKDDKFVTNQKMMKGPQTPNQADRQNHARMQERHHDGHHGGYQGVITQKETV